MSELPDTYRKLITPLIDIAREFLEEGRELEPMAFICSFTQNVLVPIPIFNYSESTKDISALAIKKAASAIKAEFVFTIMEAWVLSASSVADADKIIAQYGSVGASPYAEDVTAFAIETRYGSWVAQVPIIKKEGNPDARTIGEPTFYYAKAEGRFAHFLPELPGTPAPPVLH